MLGDRAPVAEISALKREYAVYRLLEEAHSLGVLGKRGRGLAADARVARIANALAETDWTIASIYASPPLT